ncbi:hypothetical protein WNY51_15135 [Pseudocolwellia sp. AS88]|uniref:hypothetical protein n=1 Tax=Pseudocolwellia sp. AS88 TaxID=3063958 RepID=UPI0026F0DDD0|nr:hypothetical protein [Pseudocolwellia sp. AS88]MDO7083607.1 hypothetical protein [Pseudocolwellia sp. AS88]
MAKARSNNTDSFPLTYGLDTVTVTLTKHAGAKKGSSSQHIQFLGTGLSILEKEGKKVTFNYSHTKLIKLLNNLYSIHFFNLPTRYNIKYSVYLKEDGTVNTNALRMVDASSTTICFNIPSFEKCVTYSSDGPTELQELTKYLFSEAEQLANITPTKK